MGNLFNPDNRFFTFMGKVADLMVLNLLCILCCLPIVTIGPSITAIFYVTLKMVRGEETYIAKNFFHSFKDNLRQGIIIHLIMVVIGAVLAFDLYFCWQLKSSITSLKYLSYVFATLGIIYLMVFMYIYPLLAKFSNTIKNTFKNALLISIRHFPKTLLMIVITALPLAAMIFNSTVMVWGFLFFLMLGFSTIAYINSTFFVNIFDNYIPESEKSNPEDTEWKPLEFDESEVPESQTASDAAAQEIFSEDNTSEN